MAKVISSRSTDPWAKTGWHMPYQIFPWVPYVLFLGEVGIGSAQTTRDTQGSELEGRPGASREPVSTSSRRWSGCEIFAPRKPSAEVRPPWKEHLGARLEIRGSSLVSYLICDLGKSLYLS